MATNTGTSKKTKKQFLGSLELWGSFRLSLRWTGPILYLRVTNCSMKQYGGGSRILGWGQHSGWKVRGLSVKGIYLSI